MRVKMDDLQQQGWDDANRCKELLYKLKEQIIYFEGKPQGPADTRGSLVNWSLMKNYREVREILERYDDPAKKQELDELKESIDRLCGR